MESKVIKKFAINFNRYYTIHMVVGPINQSNPKQDKKGADKYMKFIFGIICVNVVIVALLLWQIRTATPEEGQALNNAWHALNHGHR